MVSITTNFELIIKQACQLFYCGNVFSIQLLKWEQYAIPKHFCGTVCKSASKLHANPPIRLYYSRKKLLHSST